MRFIEDFTAFAASRTALFADADGAVGPYVAGALETGDWDEVVAAATQIWLDVFDDLAPDAYYQAALTDFQAELLTALSRTELPTGELEQSQVDRVARFAATAAVNDATATGTLAAGGRRLRWVSMHDDDVRTTHTRADGQIRPVGERFDVGDARLRYPGDPTGPLDEVINCRCVLAPVSQRRRSVVAATPAPAVAERDELDEIAEVDLIDDEELVDDEVDVPWHAILAPEEIPTGDGRMFGKDSLSWRDLPLPLLYQHATGDGHAGAVRVGRIDEIWKTPDGQARARGVFNRTLEAQQVIEMIMDGSIGGASVDVDDVELDFARSTEDAESPFGGQVVFSKARIAALTLAAIGAYAEARIGLGSAFEDELSDEDRAVLASCGCGEPLHESAGLRDEFAAEDLLLTETALEAEAAAPVTAAAFAPGTKDGPGWITNPRSTARIRRYWTHGEGAAKIRWGTPGDFNRCRTQLAKYVTNPEWLAGTCANMHKEALGIWPGMERGGAHSLNPTAVPIVTLAASAGGSTLPPAEAFRDPAFTGPTPVTIDGDRIYGHIAAWGVCHIGIQNVCTTAPHSSTGYGYYRTGVVETMQGLIPVGQITMGTGHASLAANATAAAAHYDNTGSVVADVVAGEDAYGIWFAGMLRPSVTEEQRRALGASALSGDWRSIAGKLELVAALAVNVPGFPIPRGGLAASGQAQTALVAAGVLEPAAFGLDRAGEIAAIARAAVEEYRHQEAKAVRAEAFRPVRENIRQLRTAALRSKFRQKEEV